MVKIFKFLLVIFFGFTEDGFYRYFAVEGYPFRAAFEDSNHFDSVDQYDLPSQSEIDISSTNSFESWPFSFWQQKSETTENAAELMEFKTTLKDKNIIHLMARPLQVYYHDNFDDENSTKAIENHICRATVSPKDIYHTFQIEDSSINILFLCSTGKCCGLDCCRLNVTFIFAISCICLAIASFTLYFIIRSLSESKKLRKILPFLNFGKHHRIIQRANARRKIRLPPPEIDLKPLKRSSDSSIELQESPPTRKKSQSVKIPASQRLQLPEVLLGPGLAHSNSVPSKQRKPKTDIIL